MDINDLLVRRLLNEAPRGQDSSRIMALRLQQPQAPSGPLLDKGSVWAHALTQGINALRGGWMEADAERRQQEREERNFERVRQLDRERVANESAALSGLNLPWMPAPAAAPDTAPQSASTPAPVTPVDAAPLPNVPPRGEAPAPVAAGIAARRALDPNSPTYAEDIQRINNGVVSQTIPGARPQPVSTQAPAAPSGTPQVTVEQLAALAQLASGGNRAAAQQLQIAQTLFNRQEQERARREARADALANRQPQTITTADGIYVLNQSGSLGARLGDSPAQARPPATREERDDAILFGANADPNSPDYAAAYFRRFMTPRLQQITGPNGEVMWAQVAVSPPPGMRPPGTFQGAQGQPAAPQGGAMPAMATGMQPAGPVMSDTPAPAVPQAAPPAAMPNAAPVPAQMQAPAPAASGLNIQPVITGQRQAPPPAGYERDPTDPNRVRPIPGSSQERDAQRAQRADTEQRNQQQRAGGLVIQEIDRALRAVDSAWLPTTGLGGAAFQNVPGTAAFDVNRLLDTVRAETGFTRLQQMREASPTGAALGSVTERELALLQATFGSLEQSQSQQQFRDNLNRVANVYLDIIHGPGQGPERRRLSFEPPGTSGGRPPLSSFQR